MAETHPWRPWLRLALAGLLVAAAALVPALVLDGPWSLLVLLPSAMLGLAAGFAFLTAFGALCLGHERYAAIEATLGLAFWLATALSLMAMVAGMPPGPGESS